MPGMPIAYFAYLAPEIFGETKRLIVTYDEQIQTVSIDLSSLVPWPDWMQRLDIKLEQETEEVTVVVQSETGPLFEPFLQQRHLRVSFGTFSKPNP